MAKLTPVKRVDKIGVLTTTCRPGTTAPDHYQIIGLHSDEVTPNLSSGYLLPLRHRLNRWPLQDKYLEGATLMTGSYRGYPASAIALFSGEG